VYVSLLSWHRGRQWHDVVGFRNFSGYEMGIRMLNLHQFKQQLMQVIYSLMTVIPLVSAEKWISPCCVNLNMFGKTLIYSVGYMHKEPNVVRILCNWQAQLDKAPPPTHTQLIFMSGVLSLLVYFRAMQLSQIMALNGWEIVQTGSGAHPASYSVGIRGSFLWGKAPGAWSWPLTSN
jgi:hypothetical protein